MDRRRVVQLFAAGSISSLVGCVESATNPGQSPTDGAQSRSETATTVEGQTEATTSEAETTTAVAGPPESEIIAGGPTRRIGPSEPNCPSYDGEGEHWGMMDTYRTQIDEVLDTQAAAYQWADEQFSDPKLVTGVETILWRNRRIDIAAEYDAERWFLIRAGAGGDSLLLPRDDSTAEIAFIIGDC